MSPQPVKPLKFYQDLAQRKGRLQAGAFLVEGDRAISQVAEVCPKAIMELITVEGMAPPRPRFPTREVTEGQFRAMSQTKTPQGVLAVVRMPEGIYSAHLPADPGPRVLLLEDIQDPGNTGTLIRSAAALGFTGAVLSEGSADPLSPKAVQATAGSVLSIWLRRTKRHLEILSALKERGYFVAAADLEGAEDLAVLSERGNLVLALGNEADGLSAPLLALADSRLRVPTARGKAESLNVAACGAILMYLASRQGTHYQRPGGRGSRPSPPAG